ncbi:molybdopterin-synthase adenylyltransferase MoeB [Nisaea acidiphila]|uniref:Molybdopterin-synthase adenylyltransferase n=1 Tax=Nisaea acidiphila TaxID=1862145 RepID=A0A9J7AYF5_9PROT|nr:molybdopterin-synthase adenylyltransferase MoeB [Nisaea acidiphila]UUX52102.1 molybdopterin-synthase adenylyltransferase MoeB [Nisaea acidiphila]
MELSDEQFQRYARHLILDEVGDEGQEKLLVSKVLVIGAGGLGSPLLLYLAAAGVGTLGIVDDDEVDLSNLQRQIAHDSNAVGLSKVESAAASVARINPGTRVEKHAERLTAENAARLFEGYDLIADGSDNFATRYLANDAAFLAGKPLVSGSLLRFEGQLATFRGGVTGHEGEPCYRCLFPTEPPPGMIPRCEEAGILGAVAGVIGTLQATEVIKELLGLGSSLSGHLLIYDALGPTFRKMKAARDPGCALCGTDPTIRDLA